jgi:predicted Fe-Mo cluster-binding NifX family protein
MKLAISAMGRDLDAQVDPNFGRCQCFIIVDSDTLEFEAIENPNIGIMSNAGVQSGQMMADRGVQVILTGNIGPNAFRTLSAAGVQVVAEVNGTLREAIHKFDTDQLRPLSRATVPEYFSVITDSHICMEAEDDEFA